MAEPPSPSAALELPGPVEPSAILRQVAPRMIRDALGPLAVFFAGWKLVGLAAGISSALVFGLAMRHGGQGECR